MMFLQPLKFGAARNYGHIDLASRIEGASPHGLVVVLYEELLKAMDAMIVAMRRRDYTQRATRQGRVLSILLGLETSLDHEQGGEIARDLSLVYRQARRLTMEGSRNNDVERVGKAREMVGEIASAWERIAA